MFILNIYVIKDYYLPEWHDFPYIGSVPWPQPRSAYTQLDWIDRVVTLELWLNNHVGDHHVLWAWHSSQDRDSATVAFRWEKHKTLFVLTWY